MEPIEAKKLIVDEVAQAIRPDIDNLKGEVKDLADKLNAAMVKIMPMPGVEHEFTPRQAAEAKAAWYRHVLGKGLPWEAKAWATDVSHSGAELVPSLVAGDIVQQLDNTPFRKVITQYPYSPKGTVPAENALPVAYRMTTRGTAVTEAAPTTAEITYATYGLMAWMGLDNKLLLEASPRTVAYIENALVRALARKEMTEWTLGAGSGSQQMTGMVGRATALNMTATHDTLAEIDLTDAENLYWKLDGMYLDNAKLFAPATVLAKLEGLNTTTKTVIDLKSNTFMGTVPIVRMPEACFDSPANGKVAAYFGDPSYYYLFQDGPVSIGVTTEGKTAVTTDQTFVAVKAYTDGNLVLPAAMVALKYLT